MATAAAPKSVGEIDSFVTMLRTACSDKTVYVYERLERLLSLPDRKRQAVVHAWVTDLLIAEAPRDFIQAIACLVDDQVAEKAYEVIYQCQESEIISAVTRIWPQASNTLQRRAFLIGAILVLSVAIPLGVWLLWPAEHINELEPAASVRPRSPAIKAYEDMWWGAARGNLGSFCGGLASSTIAAYSFIVFVDSEGQIVRVDVRGTSSDSSLASQVEQVLRATNLPAFAPEQRAEKRTLGLRGNLFIRNGKCQLQRT